MLLPNYYPICTLLLSNYFTLSYLVITRLLSYLLLCCYLDNTPLLPCYFHNISFSLFTPFFSPSLLLQCTFTNTHAHCIRTTHTVWKHSTVLCLVCLVLTVVLHTLSCCFCLFLSAVHQHERSLAVITRFPHQSHQSLKCSSLLGH